MKKILISLVITSFILSSCDDDFEPGRTSQHMDKIGYSISMAQDDEFKSRGSSTNSQVSVRKLDANIGGKDLYLHTVVSNNIPQSVTALKNSTPISRGSITDSESIDEIAVSAIVINDSEGPKGWPYTGEHQMYMNNEPVYRDYNWTTGRYWPQEQDSIRFYAYSPVGALDDESQDYTKGLPNMSNNEPGFYYRVNDDVAAQQDLLVAAAQYKGNYCKPAQINMCHALTAVELKLSDEIEGFTIKHLSISGVKNDGTYSYDFTPNLDECENSRDDGHWTLTDLDHQQGEYVLYDDEQGVELNGTQVSLGDNLVLMMMPQTLTDDATITVTGTDHITGLDITLTANIGDGPAWGKGQHVVYTLSFNPTRIEYIIEVTPTKELDANGRYLSPFHGESNINYTVRSFKRTTTPAEIIEEPLEWEIDASTLPAWIDHITLSGGNNAICTYSVLPNLTSSTSHNTLKTQTPLGTEDAPWDLSRNAQYSEGATPHETANCYIVTAPGWYALPLVYGNGIFGGQDNKAAYQGDINGTGPFRNGTVNVRRYDVTTGDNLNVNIPIQTILNFCNRGGEIKGPWVTSANGRGGDDLPTTANIVWQDEPCLVTDLRLNETKDYIIFKVPDLSINEGNVVISVKDGSKVCWSWHIWVTDGIDKCNGNGEVYFKNDISLNNRFVTSGYNESAQTPSDWGSHFEYKFNVMPSNIGACDADTKTYTEETFDVTFKLLEGGQEVAPSNDYVIRKDVLKVGVSGNTVYMTDNATYYQFGRKDPMIPGLGNGQDKPVYLNDRSKKTALPNGGYQDVFYKINKDQGVDNGTVVSFGSISLHVGVINPGYFFGGDSNDERIIDGLMYETWTTRETYGEETIPDFFINLWDGTFNDMPVYSHADISNAVDYYNALQKALNRSVVKTVYDPCPPGYEMPRFDVFTGFSFDGQNVSPFLIQDVSAAAGYSIVDDVNLDNVYPSISSLVNSGIYQGLKFYTKTMPRRQAHSAADISSATNRIYIHAIGHRNRMGQVASYNHFSNALTATPLCIRWIENNNLQDYYKFQGSRFCAIGKPNYSMRSVSTSSFDLAFPVIPARTGCNPSTIVVDQDNAGWTQGTDTDYSQDF